MQRPKSYRLNYSQMLEFVGLYRDRPELWDPGHPGYKDRPARGRALREISAAMALPGFGPHEVANKIKNLRTTFRQEKKKVLRCEEVACSPDQLYRPRLLWYEIVDGFLGKTGLRHYDPADSSTAPGPEGELAECSVEDEFDLFARSLAVQLRKMPLSRALPAMERLLAVLREERLKQEQDSLL